MTTELYIKIREYLRDLIAGTEWEGHVYAVGGCCRDELMAQPIKDVDLAVDLPSGGIRFAKWLWKRRLTTCPPVTFPMYGTAMLRLCEFPDDELELVQTRKEKYTDRTRRNPETVFGSLEDDCLRRDLTINSLYYDITRQRFVDITGHGADDIRRHIIRTPTDPDITYDDDPLRILRCIRFASRYGWEIEPATLEAMERNADRLAIITVERVRTELEKMLTCAHPAMALELLRTTGAMRYVLPELCDTFDKEENSCHLGNVWQHTLRVVENVDPTLPLRMAALFLCLGAEAGKMAEQMLRRLKCSVDFIREVVFLVSHHEALKDCGPKAERLSTERLRAFQHTSKTRERYESALSLIDADNRAYAPAYSMPDQVPAIRQRTQAMDREGTSMFDYTLPLTGDEVMEIKGLPPSPAVRDCIGYLWQLAFSDPLRTREDFVKRLIEYTPHA